MSQTQEEIARTIESASIDNLPAPDNKSDFLALANKKVELDLEDAPFLNDDYQEPEAVQPKKADKKESRKAEKKEKTPEEQAASSKKKKLIIIGVGILALLIGLGIFILPGFFEEEPILQNVIVVPSKDVRSAPKALQVKYDNFTLQCIDETGKVFFIRASFVLSTTDNAVYTEISNNQKVFRDIIYYYLNIQEPEILLNSLNHKELKEKLFEAVNKYIVSGNLDDLFFDTFIIF